MRAGTKSSYESPSKQLGDGIQAGELSVANDSESSDSIVAERHMIQRNVRANNMSRKHVVTWVREDTNTALEIREWMAKIRPGDTVCVYPKARFRGWVNYVEYAKIEVFCAWG